MISGPAYGMTLGDAAPELDYLSAVFVGDPHLGFSSAGLRFCFNLRHFGWLVEFAVCEVYSCNVSVFISSFEEGVTSGNTSSKLDHLTTVVIVSHPHFSLNPMSSRFCLKLRHQSPI